MKHCILNISKERLDSINEKIIEELGEVLIDIKNTVLLILQAHLYIESLLDRFISGVINKTATLKSNFRAFGMYISFHKCRSLKPKYNGLHVFKQVVKGVKWLSC